MKRLLGTLLVLAILLGAGWAEALTPVAVPKDYIVLFKQDKLHQDYKQVIRTAGGEVTAEIPQIGAVLVRTADSEFIGAMAANSQVEEAGLNVKISQEMEPAKTPDSAIQNTVPVPGDLYRAFQWDIQRVGGKPETWAKQPGNHRVVVAVVDTGIDATHPDLAGNYLYGKSFVPGDSEGGVDAVGHGTHVAGIIAANGRVMGVGPGLGLASYRVFGSDGAGSVGAVAQAIVTAADDGVAVINLSLEGYAAKKDKQSMAEYTVMKKAVSYAQVHGVTVVAAAGNQGFDLQKKNQLVPSLKGGLVEIPAGLPGTIGVSATNKSDQLAFYSNYGNSVIDFTAPGGDLGANFDPATMTGEIDYTAMNFSTAPGGGYQWLAGTSMATPKVSAIAGLIVAQKGKIGPKGVSSVLRKSAEDIGKPGRDRYFGSGMVDALAAVNS